ncbi:MAG TPA: Yip1 family protein [Candidatus Paceibacterota bacterium]
MEAINMTEKKSLDFNFLDESPKQAGEKASAEVVAHPVATLGEKVNFFRYLKECYTNFNAFCRKYLGVKNPPYLIVLIWVFGMGSAADRLIGSLQDYTSWGEIWAIVLFGGILAGALGYFIGGWWYNVRVGWSKGKENVEMARGIYLFTSLPVALVSILSLALNQMAYGQDYLDYYYSDASTVDLLVFFVLLAAYFYTIRLSYKAVREVMGAERQRAIGWFIVLPSVFYGGLILLSAM